MEFHLQVTPPSPTVASPANNASNIATNTSLTWNAATGATRYHVQIGTSSSFSSSTLMWEDSTITGTSCPVGLVPSTTNYWRVRSGNQAGWSGWSSHATFNTQSSLSDGTTWKGTIRLSQTTIVPTGSTLNAAPGTTIKFNASSGLYVLGSFNAAGVQSNRITLDGQDFESNYLVFAWESGNVTLQYVDLKNDNNQVDFRSTGNLIIDHCTFAEFDSALYSEGGGIVAVYGSAVSLYRDPEMGTSIGNVSVTNSSIICRNQAGWGLSFLYVQPTSLSISGNNFQACYVGLNSYCTSVSASNNSYSANTYGVVGMGGGFTFQNSTFTGNTTGIYFSYMANATVSGCTVLNVGGVSGIGGIGMQFNGGTLATIQNCRVETAVSYAHGFYIGGNGASRATNVALYSDTIRNFYQGIYVFWNALATIGANLGSSTGGNLIENCEYGVNVDPTAGGAEIYHNRIYAQTYYQKGIDASAPVSIEYNSIRGLVPNRSDHGIVFISASEASFQYNTISYWYDGAGFDEGCGGWLGFNYNNFESNIRNASSWSSTTVYASPNWWGTNDVYQVPLKLAGPIYYIPICTTRVSTAGPYGQAPGARVADPPIFMQPPALTLCEVPKEFALRQNYPNPFNPSTRISFDLPGDCEVTMLIYDMLGRRVRTVVSGMRQAGYHSLPWDGNNDEGSPVVSGFYLYRLVAKESATERGKMFTSTRKMLLVR